MRAIDNRPERTIDFMSHENTPERTSLFPQDQESRERRKRIPKILAGMATVAAVLMGGNNYIEKSSDEEALGYEDKLVGYSATASFCSPGSESVNVRNAPTIPMAEGDNKGFVVGKIDVSSIPAGGCVGIDDIPVVYETQPSVTGIPGYVGLPKSALVAAGLLDENGINSDNEETVWVASDYIEILNYKINPNSQS